jgi:hypothetical protein
MRMMFIREFICNQELIATQWIECLLFTSYCGYSPSNSITSRSSENGKLDHSFEFSPGKKELNEIDVPVVDCPEKTKLQHRCYACKGIM